MKAKEGESVVVTGLFVISPVLSLPFIWKGIKTHRVYAYALLVIFFAMLAYWLNPLDREDLYRHFENFQEISILHGSAAFESITQQVDFFLPSLEWFLGAVLGLSSHSLPVLSVITGMSISFFVLENKYKSSRKKHKISESVFILLFVLVLCHSSFRGFALNIRNPLAASFFLLGVYFLFEKNEKNGWLLIFMTPFIHIMSLVVIPFVYIAKAKNMRLLQIIYLFSFIGYLINLSPFISDFVLAFDIASDPFARKQSIYFGGDMEFSAIAATKNMNGVISMYFGRVVSFIYAAYLLISKNSNTKLRNLAFLLVALSNLFFSVSVLYGRFMMYASWIIILIILEDYFNGTPTKRQKKYIYLLTSLTVIGFFFDIFATRGSMADCVNIFLPFPFLTPFI